MCGKCDGLILYQAPTKATCLLSGNGKKMNKDLFEEVALRIGCRYVSDMRDEPFRRFAKETLAQSIDLGEYPLGVLSDMYEYLYGKKVNFETYDQAKNAFVV